MDMKLERDNTLNELFILNQRLREAQNVVLYGAGYLGKKIYDFLVQEKIRVTYFCDSMKYGSKTIDGVEIIAPEKLLMIPGLCVVITVAQAWKAIYDKLLKLGISKEDIISHIKLNNLYIVNKEVLQGKNIFISGTSDSSLRILYQLLAQEIGIEGFLDDQISGGRLLNIKVYAKKEIKNWNNTLIIVPAMENTDTYPTEAEVCVDNSYKGYFGEEIYVGKERISIRLLHELKSLKKNRKLAIYGIGEYALKCYKILQMLGYEIEFFISSTDADMQIEHKRVVFVYDLIYQPEEYYIFVCVEQADYEKVTLELRELGYHEMYDYSPAWKRRVDRIYDPHLGYISLTVESGKEYNGFYTFPAKLDTPKFKILVLGGSTSDPWYAPVKLWCEVLRDICHEHGYNVEIITGGIMGYISAQELIKLIRDGINLDIDLVVSYSGGNDLFYSNEYPFLNAFQIDACIKFDNLKKGLKSSRGLQRKEVNPYCEWLQNERMMHGILNELNIPFLAVYQPIFWSKMGEQCVEDIAYEKLHKSILSNAESYGKAIENAKIARTKIRDDASKIEWLYDFTAIFDGESGVYTDVIHCTDKGNQIIAQKMFEVLEKYLQ